MNISNQKFFITTGCSYGRSIDALHNFVNLGVLKKNGIDLKEVSAYDGTDNVVFINASAPSQGSDYQADSIIYVVSKLLELGASPNNLYCMVEWSEIGRISLPITKGMGIDADFVNWERWKGDTFQGIYHFSKEVPNKLGKITQGFTTNSLLVEYLSDNINISCGEGSGSFSKIEDTHYISVNTWDFNSLKGDNMFKIMCEEYSNAVDNLPHEFYVRRYVDNIVKTQTFLKTHNIKYNFCQIYSQFSGWYEFPNTEIRQFHIHDSNKWFENISLLKERFPNNKSKEIDEVFPNLKPIYQLIDWDNFWFHRDKTGVFAKGGIDEWCIDTYGESAYGGDFIECLTQALNTDNYTPWPVHSGITGHPNYMFYWLLFNKIVTNCDFFSINEKVLKKVEKIQEIDSKSNEYSESLIFTSEKYTKQLLKKEVSNENYKQFIQKNVQNLQSNRNIRK